jgi:hypothetical protein
MDSSRYGGNNSFNKSSAGSSNNYQTSYYQRPLQHPSQMMMAGARPQVPPHHYQQNGDHFRRGGAGDGAALRGRGGFGMMRGGGYSRGEVTNSSRNEEVRGGRFDSRTHYGGEHRYSHNYEGGSSSVQGRPTTNRLREPQPEEIKRPNQTQIEPVKREDRPKETNPRPPRRQPRKQASRPSVEDKENRPIRETQRVPRGGS